MNQTKEYKLFRKHVALVDKEKPWCYSDTSKSYFKKLPKRTRIKLIYQGTKDNNFIIRKECVARLGMDEKKDERAIKKLLQLLNDADSRIAGVAQIGLYCAPPRQIMKHISINKSDFNTNALTLVVELLGSIHRNVKNRTGVRANELRDMIIKTNGQLRAPARRRLRRQHAER